MIVLGVMFVLAHTWVILLNGTLIPNLTAAVTDSAAPGWVKGIIAVFFAAVLALIAPAVVNGGSVVINDSVLLTLALSLGSSQALWDTLWKHKVAPALAAVVPLNIGKPLATPEPPAEPVSDAQAA